MKITRDLIGADREHTHDVALLVCHLAVSFVVVVGLAGCSSSSGSTRVHEGETTSTARQVVTTSSTPPMTQVVMVSPLANDGTIADGYRVTKTLTNATCHATSEATAVGYRCSAGDILADPCWAESPDSVLCWAEPWSNELLRLTLGGPLPPLPPQEGEPIPWAIEADGKQCLLAQGAHEKVGEDVVDYYCGGDVVVLRGIDRSSSVWRTGLARRTAPSRYERLPGRVSIAKAWFGKA